MKVLVTYGSSNGGTAGLAEMVAASFRSHGIDARVQDAAAMPDPGVFDAVVVGGALYALRWSKDAAHFVKRYVATLEQMPVFFFSSGPLDDSAADHDIPPVREVRHLMERVGSTAHATFGGRLGPEAKGLVAHMMARNLTGDWRDRGHVDRWVDQVVSALEPLEAARG